MMLPDLESLRCFDAAASLLNFRAAARRVALSPPAFSDRIRRLEELLGTPLFVRTTRRVTLTAAGVALTEQARRVLDEAGRCVSVAKGGGAALPYRLTLGTRFELGLSWLTPALEGLTKAHPERQVDLYFADTADMFQRLSDGRLDAAVTSARITSSWVRAEKLHRETYVFVAAPAVVKRKALERPEHAAAHALIDVQPDLPLFRYFLDARPAGEAWGFARTEHLGAIAAVRHRVLEGAGVAVLPEYFVTEELARKKLVRLAPHVRLRDDFFRLAWRAGHRHEAALVGLSEELRKRPLR